MTFEVEKYQTRDLIRIYKSHLEFLEAVKTELFLRLDGKKVVRTIVSLDNFVK